MTKKDFEMLAAAFSQISNPDERRAIAYSMAIYLERSNPRFSIAKFIAACGLSVERTVEPDQVRS